MDDHPIVEVSWIDAGLESCQLSLEETKKVKAMPRKNVGYCMVDDKEKVVLAFGFIHDKSSTVYDQTLIIPKGIVISVHKLH